MYRGAFFGAERACDLRVSGREVVVPEERHLLLERTTRVNHAEQPALTGIVDDGARRELAAGGDGDISGLADQSIDIVGDGLVVEQLPDGGAQPEFEVVVDFVLSRAEAGTTQQVFDHMLAVPNPFSLDWGSRRCCMVGLPGGIIRLPANGKSTV